MTARGRNQIAPFEGSTTYTVPQGVTNQAPTAAAGAAAASAAVIGGGVGGGAADVGAGSGFFRCARGGLLAGVGEL